MRFIILEELFLAYSVSSLAGFVSDCVSVSSTSSWIATDSLEGESVICNFTHNDTLPKNMIVNDNSTNHVYIHDFMYVYMLLENRTSSLRQV